MSEEEYFGDGEGASHLVPARPRPLIVIDAYRNYFREHTIPKGKPLATVLSASKPVMEFFGLDRDVLTVKRPDYRGYAEARLALGKAPATVRKELTLWRAVMGHNAKEERMPMPIPGFVVMPEAGQSRVRWFTHEEYRRLILLPKKRRIQLFYLLAFGTGARSKAIEEATWDRLDWKARTLDYRVPGVSYGNKRRVVAPLSPRLYERLQAAYNDPRRDAFVIGAGGSTYYDCRRCIEAIGIDEVGVVRHVARHTFVSWLLHNKVPIIEVANLVGDRVSMLEKTYGHLTLEQLHGAVAAIDL